MKFKKGMLVKIVKIITGACDYKYIGKIGIISYLHYNDFHFDDDEDDEQITVYFNKWKSDVFYEDEVKIIGFEEQSNMFRDICFWCNIETNSIRINKKNFSIDMCYCPKCLR